MKASLFLSASALALVMMACGGAGNTDKQDKNTLIQATGNEAQDANEVLFDVFDDVDWERPLCSFDSIENWTYNELGQLVSVDGEYSESSYGSSSYRYDVFGRLIVEYNTSFTGNHREDTKFYHYKGLVRTGMGMHTTEGYPYYFASKEVCYFMDEDFKYDTLCEEYSAEVSWDDYNEDDTYAEGQLQLARYTTKRYKVVNGETKLDEKRFYHRAQDDPDAFLLGYCETYVYNTQGLLVSVVHRSADGQELQFDHYYFDNVMDSLTCYARRFQFKPFEYVEPKENIVQKVAERLIPEEYLEGLVCQNKTVASVPIDDGETETIACYQRTDGSWLVLEYWPTQGPENDKLSVYTLRKDGRLQTGDVKNLPTMLEEMQLSRNQLFFPYQGGELQFGKDYFIFPIEDEQPLRLEWTGEQFFVKK